MLDLARVEDALSETRDATLRAGADDISVVRYISGTSAHCEASKLAVGIEPGLPDRAGATGSAAPSPTTPS